MARWDNEELKTIEPGDNIACKDCVYRLPSFSEIQRYKFGFCGMYDNKPYEVLWENAKCPEYEKEME